MANRKVVDLPELTTMSNDDELYIVDISDLSESSEGTSKKIKASNFVPAGGESISNKQNSLTSDGTGVKYPTVDAVRNETLLLSGTTVGNPVTGDVEMNGRFVKGDSTFTFQDPAIVGDYEIATTADISGSGATNLGYTTSPTNGIVTSDTGTDATIPLADGTNAGLLKPAKFTVLENTSGTNTGDQDLSGKQDTLVSGTNIKTKGGISLLGSGDIPNSAKITTTVSITNATLTVAGDVQEGKIVKIDNGVNVINYTVNGALNASFIKMGTGAITFVQGSGRTLTGANGTLILNGAVNSTASIVSDGTVDIVYINNL